MVSMGKEVPDVLIKGAVDVVEALDGKALVILEKIASEGGAVDMESVSHAASQATTTGDHLLLNVALLLILVCWLVSVVDAYTTGRKIDMEERS